MIFTCTTFKGYWPIGTAAVVVADTPAEASMKLNAELRKRDLPGDTGTDCMKPFPTQGENVRLLCDGHYDWLTKPR